MSKKNNLFIYIGAFILMSAGLGWLCYDGLSSGSVYFLNVAEARAAAPDKLAKVRLFGLVSENELKKNSTTLTFRLADKDDAAQFIPIHYEGVIPDAFKTGAEVIVEGGMTAKGVFRARSLMTKCPSKYQKANRQG